MCHVLHCAIRIERMLRPSARAGADAAAETVSAVAREAGRVLFRSVRPRLTAHRVFDQQGYWTAPSGILPDL